MTGRGIDQILPHPSDLVLQGTRTCERVTTHGNFYCHERQAGHFVRRLRLPTAVDQEHIRVEFRDGVLRVTLPKQQQQQREPQQ